MMSPTHRRTNRSESSSNKLPRTGTQIHFVTKFPHVSTTNLLTSSRNFTTDKGVFVDEYSRLSFDDISTILWLFLWWFGGIKENFHFHYFHDHDWEAIESEISEFSKSRHEQLWETNRSGLDRRFAVHLDRRGWLSDPWVLENILCIRKVFRYRRT